MNAAPTVPTIITVQPTQGDTASSGGFTSLCYSEHPWITSSELAVTWGPFTLPAYFPTSFKCATWESLAWFVYFLPMLAELN